MKRTNRTLALAGVAVVAAQLLLAGTAQAHHPEISAVAVCDQNSELVIQYTSTAWTPAVNATAAKRTNPQIDILVNNVKVSQGAYASPGFSFSGSVAAPAGSSATVTASAVGTWGDGNAGGQSSSVTVTYPTEACTQPSLGRFTGGGHQIRITDQVKVTRGLTLHCDLLLSNNLQVNWLGNKFHMTEHLQTVSCTDDPNIIQAPPPAPLDTMVGVGTGRYNNVAGYTIEFTLVDAGEPGGSDQAAMKIFQTSNPGNVVLDIPLQQLSGGNLQAHYDQPHK
jgi:hypothetical protein